MTWMNRFTARSFAGIAAFAAYSLLATGAHAQPPLPPAVRVGVLTDMNGPYSAWSGRGSVTAAELALEDFRRIRPNFSSKVELVSADFQLKPDLALGIARKWLDEGVNAIADVPHSTSALALNGMLRGSKAAFLISGAQHDDLTTKECSPNSVQWTFDTASLVRPMVTALTRVGQKNWFFITVDFAGGKGIEDLSRTLLQEAGGSVMGSVRNPIGAPDFSSYLLQAQASKAQVVALVQGGSDTVNAMKQADEFGIAKGGQKIAVPFLQITDVQGMGLPLARGLVFTEAFYWDADDAKRAFARRFAERNSGRMPTAVQAGAYSAVLNYLLAVDAAATVDGPTVIAKMKELPVVDAVMGPGKVRADGRMVHDMFLVEAKQPGESKAPWDLYRVVRRIPGDEAYRPLSKACSLVK